MQDLLKKIIEMDEQARKIEEDARREKIRSEEEIERLREDIYNDYIERAKERVEKNIAVDQAHADERLALYRKKTDAARDRMQQLYGEKGEEWVDEIVRRALA